MARRWTAAAVTCLAAALLAGCSGGTQQASTTLPTTSAPAAAAASPTLPPLGPPDFPMPADARQQTPQGFNAFTRYYVSLINRLQTDLDPTYLRQLSRGCSTCDRIAGDAQSDSAKGYRYEGGTLTITALAPAHLTSRGAENAFTADQTAYAVVDAAGNHVAELSGAALPHMPAGAQGVWSGDHWVITNLSFG
jgi:hypothetical protein